MSFVSLLHSIVKFASLIKASCIVLYCIVLYCIVLYCIVLYCIVLYCIEYFTPRSNTAEKRLRMRHPYWICLANSNVVSCVPKAVKNSKWKRQGTTSIFCLFCENASGNNTRSSIMQQNKPKVTVDKSA
jgi:hypothetical protein